ncbi:MAG: hypothetical protein DLM67_16505 [Candidatus Nephthysia bennettiae]|nr:MAG: hypothetical protein DLM67_16505 [Candidatus Dormibacteraeota bacterium]
MERMLDQGFAINHECYRALSTEVEARSAELFAGIDDLRVPVLIIQGAADPRPIAACDDLAERLPVVRHTVFEGAGHFPWVERPEDFRQTVISWMAELRPPQG